MTVEREPDGRTFTVIERLDEIPAFTSEADEAAWWDTHTFSDALLAELRAAPLPDDVQRVLDTARSVRTHPARP